MNETGVFQRILRRLPGFSGYVDQQSRQENEARTRAWLAERLRQCKVVLEDYSRQLVQRALIDQLPDLDRFSDDLERVIASLARPLPGASRFLRSRIDRDAIEDLYDCEANLMDQLDRLRDRLQQITAAAGDPKDVIPQIRTEVKQLEASFQERQRLMERAAADE